MPDQDIKLILGNMYLWLLILSVLGGILMLTTEFAGYTGPPYWYHYSIYVGSENTDHAPYIPIIVVVGCLFFYTTVVSLMGLKLIKIGVTRQFILIGLVISLVILGTSAGGAIAFEVAMANSFATDWWEGTGFFAGVIGGVLLFLLYLILLKTEFR